MWNCKVISQFSVAQSNCEQCKIASEKGMVKYHLSFSKTLTWVADVFYELEMAQILHTCCLGPDLCIIDFLLQYKCNNCNNCNNCK